jgi:hypothetical protein
MLAEFSLFTVDAVHRSDWRSKENQIIFLWHVQYKADQNKEHRPQKEWRQDLFLPCPDQTSYILVGPVYRGSGPLSHSDPDASQERQREQP